jgi:hypothetical protein
MFPNYSLNAQGANVSTKAVAFGDILKQQLKYWHYCQGFELKIGNTFSPNEFFYLAKNLTLTLANFSFT